MHDALVEELSRRLRDSVPNARLTATVLPLVPELTLYLLNADYPRERLDRDTFNAILERPAYWSFCWAAGQALARYLLDHPHTVAGKRVLDFGSGSGVAGIAAALAGAASVSACDLDPDAQLATRVNAKLHNVHIDVSGELNIEQIDADVVLLADVLYDLSNMPLLNALSRRVPQLLIADSRVKHIPLSGVQRFAHYETSTLPDLDESPEFRAVSLYRWQQSG